jgi:hypothetical protein
MPSLSKFKVCDRSSKIWLRVGALLNLSLIASLLQNVAFALVPSLFLSTQSSRLVLEERIGDGIFTMKGLDQGWKIESLDLNLTNRWHLSHSKAPHFQALLTHLPSQKKPITWSLEQAAKELESRGVQVLRAREAINPKGVAFYFFDLKPRTESSKSLKYFKKETFLRQNILKFENQWVVLTCIGEKENLSEHLSLCRELVEGVEAKKANRQPENSSPKILSSATRAITS